ncbi:hypothetical protein Dimus_004183 [Dionaea muscipula]
MSNNLKTSSPPLYLIFVALLLSTKIHARDDLIRESCQRTPDPQTCESCLRSDPRCSTADSGGLALIMVDVVKSKFTDSLGYVNQLVKQQQTGSQQQPALLEALRQCASHYKVVLDDNVPVAHNAVDEGDPKFGEQAMTDSGIEVDACESGFSDKKLASPLTEKNKYLQGISSVAAVLFHLLE